MLEMSDAITIGFASLTAAICWCYGYSLWVTIVCVVVMVIIYQLISSVK